MTDPGPFAAQGAEPPAEPAQPAPGPPPQPAAPASSPEDRLEDMINAAAARLVAASQAAAEPPPYAPLPTAPAVDEPPGPVIKARTDENGQPLLDVPRKQVMTAAVGEPEEIRVWDPRHESNPPPGSHSESLLVYERGVPVRVAGPTHYHQLADGRVIGGYSGGTDHDDGVKVTRIIGTHEG